MKIEVSGDTLHELMEALPKEAQQAFQNAIMKAASKNPLDAIKHWLKHYEDYDPIDVLMARIVAQVLSQIGNSICDEVEQKRKNKESYTGGLALRCAIKQLRDVADDMERTIEEHGDSECCNKKH